MLKINLGAGPIKYKDTLSLDISNEFNPDILDDITKLEKVEDDSVDTFYAMNVLEHIPQYQIKDVLTLWNKKLKKDGNIIILVPDLLLFCTMVSHGHIGEDWAINSIYSSHKSSDAKDWHKSGFTKRYMFETLADAGFTKIISISSPGNGNCELMIEAVK